MWRFSDIENGHWEENLLLGHNILKQKTREETETMEETKKTNPLKVAAFAVIAVILAASVAASIYIATGPHTAAEAVLRQPLAGPKANYEATGSLSIESRAAMFDLPEADIPFRLTVASNRYRIELLDEDDDKSFYTAYIVEEGGRWQYYDTGDITEIAGVLVAGAAFVGAGGGTDSLGLPDFSKAHIDPSSLLALAGKARFEETDDGSIVSVDGIDASYAVAAACGEDSPLKGIVGDALDGATIEIAYDRQGVPKELSLKGADAEVAVDAEFLGEIKAKVSLDLDAAFDRVGQVGGIETEVPDDAVRR